MKKLGLILLALFLVVCTTTNDTTENLDTTTTTILAQTESDTSENVQDENDTEKEIIESYVYDSEKMSPFTGLEISPELWLKRPRRVLAFKVDNNLNARPQSGLQQADTVMEILVEGGMTRFLAFFMDNSSSYVGPVRSARPTDPTLIRPYGGILVVSGATAGLVPQIR